MKNIKAEQTIDNIAIEREKKLPYKQNVLLQREKQLQSIANNQANLMAKTTDKLAKDDQQYFDRCVQQYVHFKHIRDKIAKERLASAQPKNSKLEQMQQTKKEAVISQIKAKEERTNEINERRKAREQARINWH